MDEAAVLLGRLVAAMVIGWRQHFAADRFAGCELHALAW
jgi:hypothetical protein